MYDLCVIGGGAAGMCAAIGAAQKGLKVILLDKNAKLGKKLYATGNGRCNLTNREFDFAQKYNSSCKDYPNFLEKSIGLEPDRTLEKILSNMGILTHTVNGYVYPMSMQASSVVWGLIDLLNQYSVKIQNKQEISDISINNNQFIIKCQNEEITASQVVLACGGMSYSKLGGTELGYKLAKKLGHTIETVRPSLCGMKVKENLSSLSGVRVNSTASLYFQDKLIKKEQGELQFNQDNISGIMIFNLSSMAGELLHKGKVYVEIDLLPELSDVDIKQILEQDNHRTVIGFLNGFVNDKIAAYITFLMGFEGKSMIYTLPKEKIMAMIELLRHFKLEVTELNDFESAQVCAGGVSINEINCEDFSSKKVEGLYIVGELLDIDGACGGYNITFAMLSGYKAGIGAYDKIKSN